MRAQLLLISFVLLITIVSALRADSWMDTYIDSVMQANHLPGLSATVVKDGAIIFSGDYGWANIEDSIPVTGTTLFKLASVSKTVIPIALMQLWEEGEFELDDDINDYLPFPVVNQWYPDSSITFRMLMTHTSTILDDWDILTALVTWGGDSPIPLGYFLEEYLVPGGTYYNENHYNPVAPGVVGNYSNVGASLAGYLVEAITGTEYDQYCRENIFSPLGMDESSHFFAQLDTSKIAIPYYFAGGSFFPYGYYGEPVYPCGSLMTSSSQLTRFMKTMIQYGQYGTTLSILDSATVAEILSPQFVTSDTTAVGLFWWLVTLPGIGDFWYHGGGYYGVSTYLCIFQEKNEGVIVLSNGESDAVYFEIPDELWGYAASYISIKCKMEPLDPPVVIPAGGGSFDYKIRIKNKTDNMATFDVWIDVTLPSGEMIGPIILVEDINLPPYASLHHQFSQFVPPSAPAGEYQYKASVGEYPKYAWKESSFPFTKGGARETGTSMGTWSLYGWETERVGNK